MSTCPAGHESAATDYCDICGMAMGAPAEQPAAPAAPADDSSPCPNCQTQNPKDALFCEACGYDYTTGTMPRPVEATATDLPAVSPLTPPDGSGSAAPAEAPAAASPADPAVDPATDPGAGSTGPAGAGATDSPAPALEEGWVAEVWIDPDWYSDQGSSDMLPSPGLPTVVRLKHTSNLIGRESASRNIHPEVDIANDTGVSRRHAQLTTDGTRWFVEDLGSSNGTYVGESSGALPTQPIPVGQKRELDEDDRVFVGAWTRIVVREAAEGEGL